MKKPYHYFIAGVATILLPVGIFILLIFALSFAVENTLFNDKSAKDNIYILSEINSPNQKSVVTTFNHSGGGAAGWSGLKVNVRKREENFDSSEYVFSTNSGTKVQTNWENDSTVSISYSSNDRILSLYQKGWSKDKTVKILYKKK
ncbi:hypothetical protein BH24ACI2_BH24ACI2_07280 [soil metagenome]|jgi:hypothetical protein|nr:hypothetical protein [Acidobacteriota bacterium]